MISEEQLEAKVRALSRRMDLDPPRIVMLDAHGRRALKIVQFGDSVRVPRPCLEELTEAELDFALAYAFCRYQRPAYRQVPFLLVPWIFGMTLGVLLVGFSETYFAQNFWQGFAVLFGCAVVSYLIGLGLATHRGVIDRHETVHDALLLTGSPIAAESYFIRSQAGELGTRKKTLSTGDRDHLEDQLISLRLAANRLGLRYDPISADG